MAVDVSDPRFWIDGVRVVSNAPHVVVPLMIVAAGAAWWLRGAIAKGSIEGLREQNKALEQRRELAEASERTITKETQTVKDQLATLQAQINVGAEKEQLTGTTLTIGSTIGRIATANTALGRDMFLTDDDGIAGQHLSRRPRKPTTERSS